MFWYYLYLFLFTYSITGVKEVPPLPLTFNCTSLGFLTLYTFLISESHSITVNSYDLFEIIENISLKIKET